jgi:hypothetical protein
MAGEAPKRKWLYNQIILDEKMVVLDKIKPSKIRG